MRFLAAIAVSLASVFALTPLAVADDAPQTMVVIDGSGSMWGRLDADKRAKIDIVRELMQAKVAAAGSEMIGLTSYGHRRKSDCNDVEVISTPSTDHTVIMDALAKLNPRGKGPLAAALREAVSALGAALPASVIVVNDGVDNCRQDTCATADDIARTAPGVTIHMVSIGVDPGGHARLTCIAEATGGTFHNVQSSEELTTAIDAVTALALRTPDGATPGAAPAAQSSRKSPVESGLQAGVSLTDSGAPIDLAVHWRIFQSGGTTVLAESDGPSLTAHLDPGTYDVEAEYNHIRVKKPVTIAAGQGTNLTVPLNAGRLKIAVKDTNTVQPQPLRSYLLAIEPVIDGKPRADQSALLLHTSSASEVLPAGTYNVTMNDGPIRQSKSVTLTAGTETAVNFTSSTGRLELSAGLREDGGALDDVTFTISEDDPDSPDGRREIARSRAPTPTFTLPAGTYYVSAHSGDGEVRQRIAVGAGDVVKRALILPLVPVKISALIGGQLATDGQGIAYRVTELDGDRRELVRSVQSALSLSLLPGRYRVSAHLDAHHLKAAEEISVEAGKSLNVVLKFNAGEINLKPGAGIGPGASDTYWEILDASGKPVWRTVAADAHALLVPGRYTVRAEWRDKHTEAAFEIRAGERKVVEVGQN
ncbi:MAG: VWA domain-containing protein [Hyphomicrobium sp.]